jgi:hypothetical protein
MLSTQERQAGNQNTGGLHSSSSGTLCLVTQLP